MSAHRNINVVVVSVAAALVFLSAAIDDDKIGGDANAAEPSTRDGGNEKDNRHPPHVDGESGADADG